MSVSFDFYKFDGAGNDFVVIDNRGLSIDLTVEEVARICHRRFGVGADGLMTLDEANDCDFEMHYYNSDGNLGSMCGNGGRCIAMFASLLGMGKHLCFRGFDGMHEADILTWDEDNKVGIVRLGMRSLSTKEIKKVGEGWFIDTGSPHYVVRVENLNHYDVVAEGRRLRHRKDLFPEGANIDFVEDLPDGRLYVRTYERGVEDETWACGTGVTACSIVSGNHRLVTRGGDFRVDFDVNETEYNNVQLTGPVALNFTGKWTCSVQ